MTINKDDIKEVVAGNIGKITIKHTDHKCKCGKEIYSFNSIIPELCIDCAKIEADREREKAIKDFSDFQNKIKNKKNENEKNPIESFKERQYKN